jgi:hypothetical protein
MKLSDMLWEIIDNGMFLLHLVAVLVVAVAAIACPVWLALIHHEVVSMRELIKPCECRCDDGPGPVLPRVLPRVRRIGEGVNE